jgi:flagellar hook-associated protein 3 FlgL
VFQALIGLRGDLRNTRGLSEEEQAEVISQRLDELDRVHSGILSIVGEQGAELQNLDGLESRTKDVQVDLRSLTSDLKGVDLPEVVLSLQSQQNLLQLTQASTARVFDQSLLDFIR